jgi:hypothetical protein
MQLFNEAESILDSLKPEEQGEHGLWRTGHARFTSTAGVFYLHMLNDFKG